MTPNQSFQTSPASPAEEISQAGRVAPFSLYIHVPFCMRRCGYCDFNTYTASDLGGGASRDNYANLAVQEMVLVKQWQEEQGIKEPALSTVFFGGGTPTILPAHDLISILSAARDIWGICEGAEITTEANPDTVDSNYIHQLADGGFTRISFGMQSAVPSVLATLDRTHTPAHVESGVRASQKAGLRTSLDLIYGTPGESLDQWEVSLRAALDLGVTHISAYALTVEPHTAMGRRISRGQLPAPDDDDQAEKYRLAERMLTDAGLSWYEVSNWALPGDESRHNLGYWHNIDWAGIGPGAHSHYNFYNFQPLRAWDIAHPRAWAQTMTDDKRVPWQGQENISPSENLEEAILLGVRIRDGLSLDLTDSLAVRQGLEPLDESVIHDLESEGLVTVTTEPRILIPTLNGRLLNDLVIERLFNAYKV